MASNYTENYGLCQWEAGDAFTRTEFNADNAKLDAALGRTERGMEANRTNLYNLLLQRDYEGKYTGWKQALIFDGFQDDSKIESLTAGFERSNVAPRLYLDNSEGNTKSVNYGKALTYEMQAGETLTQTWTVDRLGMAGWIDMYASGTLSMDIASQSGHYHLVNERTSSGSELSVLSFPFTIELEAGEVYTFTLTAKTAATVGRATGSSGFGFSIYLTKTATAASGTLITTPLTLDKQFTNAKIVVRRSLVTPYPSVFWKTENSETWNEINRTSGRTTLAITGEEAGEDTYTLSVPEGIRTIQLKMEVGAFPTFSSTIFDYAIIIL